jgi:hypothetical protein
MKAVRRFKWFGAFIHGQNAGETFFKNLSRHRIKCELFIIAEKHQKASNVRMKAFLPILVVLIFVFKLAADETNSPALLKIGANEAYKYYEKEMIVTGKVVQVTIRPKIAFLNIDHPFPDESIALVIYSSETNKFSDLRALEGKSVEVSGKIRRYRFRPEIILDSTNQLKVIETKD